MTHEFVVTQGAQSVSCLHELESFSEVGQVLAQSAIRQSPRTPISLRRATEGRYNRNDHSVLSSSRPLRSSKSENFAKFAKCLEWIDAGEHLSTDGLIRIVELVQTMNRRKPRTELIRILRGHTPNIQDTG